MDSITFAQQSFLEACESLVVACELNDCIEAQAVINKAIVAYGVFSSVKGHICPAHDEKFAKNIYVLVQALEESSAKVFGINHLSF